MKKLGLVLAVSLMMAVCASAAPVTQMMFDAANLSLGNGDNVTAWADTSGNGRDLTAQGGSPTFVASAVNGKPAVRFTGAPSAGACMLTAPLATPISQAFSVFTVIKINGNNGAPWDSDYVFDTPDGYRALMAFIPQDTMCMWAGGGAGLASQATNGYIPSLGQWAILEGQYNGAASKLFINGTQIAAGDIGTSPITQLFLGSRYSATNVLNGDMAQFAVYSNMGAGDRDAIGSDLQSAFGISGAYVPEPATMSLLVLGGLALLRRRR